MKIPAAGVAVVVAGVSGLGGFAVGDEKDWGEYEVGDPRSGYTFAAAGTRANLLSQGHANGFPSYRLKWRKLGSLHRRFRGCNKQVRAKPFAYAADEYVNLELYLAWRGRGLPVAAPAVRN